MFHPRHNKSLQGSPFAIRANAALPNPQSAGPLYEGLKFAATSMLRRNST